MFIWDSTDIQLEASNKKYYYVYGEVKRKIKRNLSPFLISNENGNILVFNNWNKSKIDDNIVNLEYINYLDGR